MIQEHKYFIEEDLTQTALTKEEFDLVSYYMSQDTSCSLDVMIQFVTNN